MAEFDRYRVHFYSARQYDWDVRIDLDWHGTPCATLLFMKAGRALPPNSSDNGVILLHFPITQYPALIDLLRNEEPLYASLNADNGVGLVSTGAERVGEDEGS